MKTSAFDFDLPENLIAQKSADKRIESRLMVYHKKSEKLEHKIFKRIVDYFNEGDLLVLNNTKVIPARLFGKKTTGAEIELLLLKNIEGNLWEALAKPRKRLKVNKDIIIKNIKVKLVKKLDWGGVLIKFPDDINIDKFLDNHGKMPVPPYIKNENEHYLKKRYQTVFAEKRGSVAAPTSGLHFSQELLEKLKKKGVNITYITLHVGLGTFRPVKVENIEDFDIHSEYYEIEKRASDMINNTNGKIVACGTTVTRTLEYLMSEYGEIKPGKGWCDLFIYPGYEFKIVNNLITNFHLPKSTLLMLISAMVNRDKILELYENAVNKKYRFFSFGDAMFIMND